MGTDSSGSSGVRRRRADAERNVEAILTAARELLSTGTLPSMGEVAAAAGVGRVTLYAHFGSRELLLEAVVRRGAEDTDGVLAGMNLEADAPDVALDRLVHAVWPILDRHRAFRTITQAAIGSDALRAQHDPVLRHVEVLLERGRADGRFRADLPLAWLVTVFYTTLHAAADEVTTGALDAATAPDVVTTTLQSTLRA